MLRELLEKNLQEKPDTFVIPGTAYLGLDDSTTMESKCYTNVEDVITILIHKARTGDTKSIETIA